MVETTVNKYHIRFNHNHNGSGFVWRIFENGTENLVKAFRITVPMYDEQTIENGIEKWNVACEGKMTITDGKAIIE